MPSEGLRTGQWNPMACVVSLGVRNMTILFCDALRGLGFGVIAKSMGFLAALWKKFIEPADMGQVQSYGQSGWKK